LAQAFGEELAARVRTADARLHASSRAPAGFPWRGPATGDLDAPSFWCSLHESGDALVLELEPEPAQAASEKTDAGQRDALAAMSAVRALHDLDAKLTAAAELLRTLSGYDRVMIYRFDPVDWHGEVVAESRAAELQPYLGLHFPASDIPSQARALYLTTPTRVIADIEPPPAPLLSAPHEGPPAPLDLSRSVLRAVSPVHLEYLLNMGVRATLTGSLVCNGRLWGLVACHHRGPRRLSGRVRELIGWLSEDLATQIALVETTQSQHRRAVLERCRERIIAGMRRGSGLAELIRGPGLGDILGAVAAEGVALVGPERVLTGGATPGPARCADLAARLVEQGGSVDPRLFASDCLSRHLPGTDDLAEVAASVLMLSLDAESRIRMLFFRGELPRRVTWGGNPAEPVDVEADGRISPRKSFAAWQETVRLHGPRWLAEELDSARELGVLMDIESCRTAAQRVRDLQARLQSMLDNAPAGVFFKDLDGRYVLVNRRCEAFFGRTNAELRGKRSDEVLSRTTTAAVMARDAAVIDSLRTQTSEDSIDGPDGPQVLLTTRFPLRDGEGRPSGMAGISLDITERRRMEEGRDIALAKYRALFERFPLGITVCDENGRILESNPASERILGVPLTEQIERTLEDPKWVVEYADGGAMPPSEFPAVRAFRQRITVADQEMVLVLPAGERRWLNVSAVPLAVAGLGALAVYEDVTERKQFEARRRQQAALRESERRFRLMADELPVMVWVMDRHDACVMVNKTCCAYLGTSEDDLVGQGFIDFLHPDDRTAYAEIFHGAGVNQVAAQGLTRIRRADGAWRWIESHARPVFDAAGAFTGYVGSSLDITERKAAEDALNASHRTLEHHAEQLGRLTAALTVAEQRERERLAKVLHDHLQQLLVGASLGVERLTRRLAPAAPGHAPTPTRGDTIDEALASIRALLQQSIDATRTLVADLGPPILHDAGLRAALEWLARKMSDHHGLEVSLRFEADVQPRSPELRSVLFESVREALFNVIKHAGCEHAEVRFHQADEGWLCIDVSDSGSGFDVANVAAGAGDGTGFGILAMRERLRYLGGSCEIASSPGAGTRILLCAPASGPRQMPLREQTVGKVHAGSRLVHAVSTPPQARPAVSVLLVDDHTMMREGLRALLAKEPALQVVGEARDGVEALDQVTRLEPRLVLMDYSMPRMDGLEATREIKAANPHVCVIALSRFQEGDRAKAMLAAGASAYVDKTAGAEALLDTIRTHLPDCSAPPGMVS
jgi:PAS domain S-box-containing protein